MAIETILDNASKSLEIKVSGRFDFSVHQEFRQASDKADNGVNSIVVDMGGVDYIDSSALGMLLIIRDKVGDSKSSVRIKNAKSDVLKILKIANFDKLFTLD